MKDEQYEKETKEFDASRRKLIEDVLRYTACAAILSSIPNFLGCSSSSASEKAPAPVSKVTPKTLDSIFDSKIVAVAKKGEPYDLTRRAVESLGGMKKFVSSGDKVMLLPNIAWDRSPEQAATTHPDVVKAVIDMCKESGAKEIGVFCHTCHPAQSSYKKSGIQDVSEKAGARVYFVQRGVDFQQVAFNGKVLKNPKVFKKLLASDKFINIPIAKVHSLSVLTMCMKNLMGAVEERPALHPIIHDALPDLYHVLKPNLNILDATRILINRGPTGGNLADVRKMDMVIAGINAVSVDAIGTELFDREPSSIRYLKNASDLGLGEYQTDLLELKEA